LGLLTYRMIEVDGTSEAIWFDCPVPISFILLDSVQMVSRHVSQVLGQALGQTMQRVTSCAGGVLGLWPAED
jgi:hypothetical protein